MKLLLYFFYSYLTRNSKYNFLQFFFFFVIANSGENVSESGGTGPNENSVIYTFTDPQMQHFSLV